ncbi:MAG: MerR family transcriptional regulator [Candidatus Sericytochromatia bacterium]|nr:MerR family transcriptional regulator [Candidatus Sericytochromatia bacterium]
MAKDLLIHELCEQLDITTKAVRYYEKIGIIPNPSRNTANYRVYSNEDFKRLDFIKKARIMNFSLDEIRTIINIKEEGKLPCDKVIGLIEEKIIGIDKQIAAMMEFKKDLTKNLENFKNNYESGKNGNVCGFIESITPQRGLCF